jgi:hypothetical protein
MAAIWAAAQAVIPGHGLQFHVRHDSTTALSALANDTWDRYGQITRRFVWGPWEFNTGASAQVTDNRTTSDEFGSGRDRHANIAAGTIDPALLLAVVRAAGAPAICETPDEDGGLAADISWLKQHLPA